MMLSLRSNVVARPAVASRAGTRDVALFSAAAGAALLLVRSRFGSNLSVCVSVSSLSHPAT